MHELSRASFFFFSPLFWPLQKPNASFAAHALDLCCAMHAEGTSVSQVKFSSSWFRVRISLRAGQSYEPCS